MTDQIQLISDGDGLAVVGEPVAVERFLTSESLASKDLGMRRLAPLLGQGAGMAQVGSTIAANSGRWVQLTEESAQLVKKYGLMQSKDTGLSMGVIFAKGEAKGIKGLVEFAKGPGTMLTNPAMLAGAAGIMAQLAMQQSMQEITDYLATIDEKVDDILRAHKDAAIADMLGVEEVIEEAMAIREQVGGVSEVTWSKVQGTSMTIARTQVYALRQLDAIAEKIERKGAIGDTAKAVTEARSTVQEWLAVLARCVQIQEALGVLELDRVLDTAPEDLERHRRALKTARQTRLQKISSTTRQLISRMSDAAGAANAQVLLHPIASQTVVEAGNHIMSGVVEFHGRLGIDADGTQLQGRRWSEAVSETYGKVVETGSDGVEATKRALGRATESFRSVDLDGDGVPDDPRALTAIRGVGSSIKGMGSATSGAVGSLFRRKAKPGESAPEVEVQGPVSAGDEPTPVADQGQ